MVDPVPYAFVSYARADRIRVETVVAVLERAGVRIWIDRTDIPGGANYGPEIVAAIRGAGAVLVCCSAAAFTSRNVQQEIALAWEHERSMLPLILERAELPDELAYWLVAAQWVEILDLAAAEWLPEVLRAFTRLEFPDLQDIPVAVPINLPTPLTPLLGREAELREITELLAAHRLVTLTGPGGVGKTHLAITAARAAAPAFTEGTLFVDLTAVREPDLVTSAVARAVGVRDSGTEPLDQLLARSLADRVLLLVLDNCEHVAMAAADLVADLLIGCPGVAVLATSRVRLNIVAEQVFPVAPLNVASDGNAAVVMASPAAALFAERARRVQPRFALTNENAGAVAAICRRLDGLPLAIELAAARVAVWSPDALLARLERALPLLTGGPRDMPARQRTVRDTVAWSHDLLTETEQRLFRRAAVFVGGFTLEAAEAVAVPNDAFGELDAIVALVDHNLMRAEEETDGSTRFRMLETVREFAVERLVLSNEEEDIHVAHLAYFLALAEEAKVHQVSAQQPEWLGRLERDHDNARAALGTALERRDTVSAYRLCAALWTFWFLRGHFTEGAAWLDRVMAQGTAAAAVRVEPVLAAGQFACHRGDYAAAAAFGREAIEQSTAEGFKFGVGLGCFLLANVDVNTGEWVKAEHGFGEALSIFRALGDAPWIGRTLGYLATVAREQGELERFDSLSAEKLQVSRELGDTWGASDALANLADAALRRGDDRRALELRRQSLDGHTRTANWLGILEDLRGLADLAARQGLLETAARLLGAEEVLRERVGFAFPQATGREHESRTAAVQAAMTVEEFHAAWFAGRSMSIEDAIAEAASFAAREIGVLD